MYKIETGEFREAFKSDKPLQSGTYSPNGNKMLIAEGDEGALNVYLVDLVNNQSTLVGEYK